MLPIGDSPKSARTPIVNLSLIAINVLVFLYELSLGARLEAFIGQWGVIPDRITAALAGMPGAHPLALTTMVTAMFIHAGWLHIGGNMLFLWIFGDNVEDRLGPWLYLGFYFLCGIAANLAQVYASPTSEIAAIGASGAIAGVLGAYLVTFPGARVSVLLPIVLFFWVFEIPALIVIGLWFLTQLFSGVTALSESTAQSGGVAWWAHVGGFAFGAVLMLLLPKQATLPPASRATNLRERAREDTGLVGLTVGLVSLASQVTQLVLAARLVIVFLGSSLLTRAFPVIGQILTDTAPFLRPFARIIPAVQIDGHVVEIFTIAAILLVYLVGAAVISVVVSIAYRR